MDLAEQIATLITAPFSFLKLRLRGLIYLLIYSLLAGAILALVAGLIISHQDDIKQLIFNYLFPESWHTTMDMLYQRFIAAQSRTVLINAIVTGAILLVTMLLFPLKEKVSAVYESDGKLTPHEIKEFPLWLQGLEEFKLLILYLAVQLSIIWLGYPPSPARRYSAIILSYLYLFGSFSIDFIGPIFQRHQIRYSRLTKVLALHPIILFGLGAILTLPVIIAGRYVATHANLTLNHAIYILFSASLLSIIWGVIAGTWVGAKLLDHAERIKRPHAMTKLIVSAVVLSILAVNLWLFVTIGQSLHHKSQILKCNYSIKMDSFKFTWPKWSELRHAEVSVGVAFDLEIENPTPFLVDIEKNRLEVKHQESLVAQTALAPMKVSAKSTAIQRLNLKIKLHTKVILKGRALLKDKWTITLYLELSDGFEFPIYLKHNFKNIFDKKN